MPRPEKLEAYFGRSPTPPANTGRRDRPGDATAVAGGLTAVTSDVHLARQRGAGRGRRPRAAARRSGLSGRALGDAGDAAAQHAILAVLTAERPDDVVFSEEAADDLRRLTADRVWIVDPLDGTREYGDPAATTGRCTWRCGRPVS